MTFPFVDSPPENAQYFTIHKEKTATFKTICQGEDEESWNCHQAEASTMKSSKTEILIILPKSWTREKFFEKFGATDYTVRREKELIRQKRESWPDQTQRCVRNNIE